MNSVFQQPVLFLFYGLPGSGKSAFARQSAAALSASHVWGDRIRYELYDDPRYTSAENNTVLRLADYMADELLKRGATTFFDVSLPTPQLREAMRKLAQENNAQCVIIWVQTDSETARTRSLKRDRRTLDDKYSSSLTQAQFTAQSVMTPLGEREQHIVISGKHLFKLQLKTLLSRLQIMGLLASAKAVIPETASLKVEPPINRTTSLGGRVDFKRRQPNRFIDGV